MRWLLIMLLTAQVATCGQKGPLYLPEESQLESAASASISAPSIAGPRLSVAAVLSAMALAPDSPLSPVAAGALQR